MPQDFPYNLPKRSKHNGKPTVFQRICAEAILGPAMGLLPAKPNKTKQKKEKGTETESEE